MPTTCTSACGKRSLHWMDNNAPSVGYMAIHDGDLLNAHLWAANCILHGFAPSAPANNLRRQRKATRLILPNHDVDLVCARPR